MVHSSPGPTPRRLPRLRRNQHRLPPQNLLRSQLPLRHRNLRLDRHRNLLQNRRRNPHRSRTHRPPAQPTISGTVRGGRDADGGHLRHCRRRRAGERRRSSYQWIADDTEVPGATSSTYTPVDADVGKTIKVRVSFIDGNNNQEALTSEPTASVAPGSGPLVGFTVVDASDQTVVEILTDGGALVLDDPDNGSYGIQGRRGRPMRKSAACACNSPEPRTLTRRKTSRPTPFTGTVTAT